MTFKKKEEKINKKIIGLFSKSQRCFFLTSYLLFCSNARKQGKATSQQKQSVPSLMTKHKGRKNKKEKGKRHPFILSLTREKTKDLKDQDLKINKSVWALPIIGDLAFTLGLAKNLPTKECQKELDKLWTIINMSGEQTWGVLIGPRLIKICLFSFLYLCQVTGLR